MAFPTIAVQGNSTDNTADTSGTITLPTGTYTSGDTILAFSAGRDNTTFSSPSTGWTEFIDTNSPSNDGATGGWWKKSDGTESGGTMTFTTSSSTKHPGHVICLTGAADPAVDPPEATQSGGGTSGSPNPPSHTVSWTTGEDNFFIAVWGRKAAATVSAYSSTPASPTDTWSNPSNGGGGACGIHGGCYYDTARDTVDPGAMTMTNSNDWSAATVAVRTSASGGTQTDKDLTFTGTGTLAFTRVVSYARSNSYSGVGTSSLTKQTAISKDFTATGTANRTNTIQPDNIAFSGTGTSSLETGLVSLIDRTFSGTGASSLGTQSQFVRSLSFTGTGTSVFSRIVSFLRALTFGGTGTSEIGKDVSLDKTFAGTGTSELEAVKSRLQGQSYGGTGSVTLTTLFIPGGTPPPPTDSDVRRGTGVMIYRGPGGRS